MRLVDRLASWLVCLLGLAHLLVGHAAFTAPTERRIWFASAGFLLVVTGLANLATSRSVTGIQICAALTGSLSILVLGALLARASPDLLTQPQTIILLGLGLILTIQRARELVALRRPHS
ncbi:MAG: hypothetical protein ABR588_10730 [Sphingomicrobium sp.]|nr:hypothetical protein [Sphingomonadales bacterium]